MDADRARLTLERGRELVEEPQQVLSSTTRAAIVVGSYWNVNVTADSGQP